MKVTVEERESKELTGQNVYDFLPSFIKTIKIRYYCTCLSNNFYLKRFKDPQLKEKTNRIWFMTSDHPHDRCFIF